MFVPSRDRSAGEACPAQVDRPYAASGTKAMTFAANAAFKPITVVHEKTIVRSYEQSTIFSSSYKRSGMYIRS
jgi:hypothetical protein